MGRRSFAVLPLALAILSGCASSSVLVAPRPPEQHTKLGPASGTACGSLAVISTAYNVLPIGLNSRVERAYERALASVPGATALVDTQLEESWYWYVLATARCTTISGEAIR